MQHVESVVKIFFTREYGRFKFLKGNRDINELKVKKIVRAIQSGTNILKYAPIIVNGEMEIIDGQHRWAASRQLKENIHYVIQENADLAIVPAINSNSSKWNSRDFLNSYVDLKKESYLQLRKFIDQYPQISVPTAAKLFHGGKNEAMEEFQGGGLSAKFKERAYELAAMLSDYAPIVDNPFSSRMFTVAAMLHNNGKYDHDLMVRKIKESGSKLDNIESTKSILQGIELIINHRSRQRIIIH